MFIFIKALTFLLGFNTIIFDCDGVLVDTEYLKYCGWRDALDEHSIDFTVEEYLPMVGHSGKKIFRLIEKLKKKENSRICINQ